MTHTHTHTHTDDDPFCGCGYRRSTHGEHAYACKLFQRSTFFNELQVSEEWIKEQKQLKAAERKARATTRAAQR